MGSLDGKVALITGAARGQGRSHAIVLAQEGADVILVDVCGPVAADVEYPSATKAELDETVHGVTKCGRRALAHVLDIRDFESLNRAVRESAAQLGGLDIVVANAGFVSWHRFWEMPADSWQAMLDVTLTGTFNTLKAAAPIMIEQGRGGSIIITSSVAGLKGFPNFAHYVSAKHGVIGLARTLAVELAPHSIRVNTIHPTNVNTDMIQNEDLYRLFNPDAPNKVAFEEASRGMQALPIPWVEPFDISNALVFLASDEGRYVTGITLPVDAGFMQK